MKSKQLKKKNYDGGKFSTGINDTDGRHWCCLILFPLFATGVVDTANLNKKIYRYVNSTTHRCPNKIFKTFPFAIGVNDTGGAP